jgi:hypothetical protein
METVVLRAPPSKDAVRVALCELEPDPAVAVNDAVTDPADTTTFPGTVRAALLLMMLTVAPPTPAGLVSVTVQSVDAPGASTETIHVNDASLSGSVRFKAADWELPLYEAVMVAAWLEGKAPIVTVKLAPDAPAATTTVAGAVAIAALLDSATTASPLPALDRVSKQVIVDPGFRPVDGQERELTTIRVASVIETVSEPPPYRAVSVAV